MVAHTKFSFFAINMVFNLIAHYIPCYISVVVDKIVKAINKLL